MSSVTDISGGRCAGCGTPIPASRGGRARKWCGDRCRKRQYDMACVDCGGRVDGTTPSKNQHEPVCASCAGAHFKTWTPEAVVLAIQEWADEHGGIPPTATEWSVRPSDRPAVGTVLNVYGKWNAAITAAGFEPRPVGTYGRDGELPAVIRATVELYRSGLSAAEVGELTGCGQNGVLYRLEKGGQQRLPTCSKDWTRAQRAAAILAMSDERVAA